MILSIQISFSDTLAKACPLRRLRLRLWGSGLASSNPTARSRRKPITRAERSLKTFDAVQYAGRFAAATPPLEDVVISIISIREMEDVVATPAGIVPEDGAERYRGERWEL